MSGIKIAATVAVKPEHREALLPEFEKVVAASRAEAGNVFYHLHQEIGNPNRFVFFEHWQSQAAVDEHGASAHFQAFVKALEGKTDQLDIVLLNDLSDNG